MLRSFEKRMKFDLTRIFCNPTYVRSPNWAMHTFESHIVKTPTIIVSNDAIEQ